MHNSTTQSVPHRCTNYTDFSISLHPNTTLNRKQSLLNKQKYERKTSSLEIFQTKNYMNIIQNANNQLQQYLFNLNQHIKKVIQKREANYYTAFENHVVFVQRELKTIKQTYQQSKIYQKTISLQQVIIRLQKQCQIFRNQALRYFQLLEQKQQQLKNTKRKSQSIQKQLQISQFTKKKLIEKFKLNNLLTQQDFVIIEQRVKQQFINHNIRKQKSILKSLQYNKQDKLYYSLLKNNQNKKFRKTLMNFDINKSDQYFKHTLSQQGRKLTTRSFITQHNTKDVKCKNIGGVDINSFKNQNNNQQYYNYHHHQRFHSQSKLNNFLIMQSNYINKNNINKNNNNNNKSQTIMNKTIKQQNYQQFKNILKDILITKISTLLKNTQQQQSNQHMQELQFNFNSDHEINRFLQFVFPICNLQENKLKRNQQKGNEDVDNLLLVSSQHDYMRGKNNIQSMKNYDQKQQQQQQYSIFPFEIISSSDTKNRLKTENNIICSTIYSVQKGQKSINTNNNKQKQSLFLNKTKHKIISISKKKSTLKNNQFNAQWADLKINKKKLQSKQQQKQQQQKLTNLSMNLLLSTQ